MTHASLQILLPVHNEGGTIQRTLDEIYTRIYPQVSFGFVICEDGSSDDTRMILSKLQAKFPMKLITSSERKGYSRAVIDGLAVTEADYVLCLDSDGQCDPSDFSRFWELRQEFDVVIGSRVKRADPMSRRVMSGSFRLVHKLLFRVPVRDPSCPFVLMNRKVIRAVLSELGLLEYGFWWEFTARVQGHGFQIAEVPVVHRRRHEGKTNVYRAQRIPRLALTHLIGLFRIWRQVRKKVLNSGQKERPRVV